MGTDEAITRVVIVDDHEAVAAGLAALITQQSDLVVADVATTLAEATDLCAAGDPDVILLDYRLPDADGATSLRELSLVTAAPIVVITADPSPRVLARALEAGASGFVRKTAAPQDVLAAIRAAVRGDALIDAELLAELSSYLQKPPPGEELTERQLEVLRLVAVGLSTEQIAEQLHLSVHTVRNHVRGMLEALQAHSKLEAVAQAVRAGILVVDDFR